jgi:diguanylate cyclase (GGDEF)-like protein/PAS domain S-box-containing protein
MTPGSGAGGGTAGFPANQQNSHVPQMEELNERIRLLEEERSCLLDSCSELRANQDILMEAIGAANQKQVQAEMLSMELEQVFSSCADAMWVVRKDKTVVRANGAMLALLGKSAEEVVGHLCCNLLEAPLCDEKHCVLKPSSCAIAAKEYDVSRSLPSGEQQHFIVSAAPLVTLDGTPGIVTQFKDITDRKQAEAALAKANIALARMARLDSLTQLPNRRSFDETIDQEWRRLAREKQDLALVLCDIDCFKQYNDTYGHQAGDECLRQVAKALGDCTQRAGDLACRYGGEEFIFLLPNTHLEGATRFAERVRQAVEALALPHGTSRAASVVTLSLGVAAQIPCPDRLPDVLLKAADDALYQAKESGRNCVVAD